MEDQGQEPQTTYLKPEALKLTTAKFQGTISPFVLLLSCFDIPQSLVTFIACNRNIQTPAKRELQEGFF